MASIASGEVYSFVRKFKGLWRSGCDASLQFECRAGQAFLTMRHGLGSAYPESNPPQYQQQSQHFVPKRKHASPSRIRRRERRAAAKADFATEIVAKNDSNLIEGKKSEANMNVETEEVSSLNGNAGILKNSKTF